MSECVSKATMSLNAFYPLYSASSPRYIVKKIYEQKWLHYLIPGVMWALEITNLYDCCRAQPLHSRPNRIILSDCFNVVLPRKPEPSTNTL